MPWWFWVQAGVDLVLIVYAVSLAMEGHDARDAIKALAAQVEELKRRLF